MIRLGNKQDIYYLLPLVAISLFAYYQIAFYIQQTDFTQLIIYYSLVFFSFIALYIRFKEHHKLLLFLSIAFRVIFFFSIPELSQDFYRYIWDGHLILNGFNPYLTSPDELMQASQPPFALAGELYPELTDLNAANQSNYPPMSQFFYWLAAMVSPVSIYGSMLFLKAVLFSADILVYKITRPILEELQLPKHQVFLYLLNPLLIIEGIGNLHMEPLMAAFLLSGIYCWLKNKHLLSGFLIGLSILTKLLPLLLLPFFAIGKKRFDIYAFLSKAFLKVSSIALLLVASGFLVFINTSNASEYVATISLWFNTFEFNASIYYLFRWLGFQLTGWNMIAYFGKGLTLVSLIILVFLALKSTASKNGQINALVLSLLIYFLLATTIHPWYLIVPLSVAVLSRYWLPVLVWSFSIFFSYHTYEASGFEENTYWLLAEYMLLAIAIVLSYQYPLLFLSKKKD